MQISVAMMAKGYVTQMTYITQEVLSQGRVDAGAKISSQMMKEGNMDFVKIWNEARKAQDGEKATDPDPKSVKDQLKEAVGSISNNAKGAACLELVLNNTPPHLFISAYALMLIARHELHYA